MTQANSVVSLLMKSSCIQEAQWICCHDVNKLHGSLMAGGSLVVVTTTYSAILGYRRG